MFNDLLSRSPLSPLPQPGLAGGLHCGQRPSQWEGKGHGHRPLDRGHISNVSYSMT